MPNNAEIYTHPGTDNKGLIINGYRSWFKAFTTQVPDYISIRLGMWWSATTDVNDNAVPIESESFDPLSPLTSTSSFGLFSSEVGGLPGSDNKFFIGYMSSPDDSGGGTKYRIVDDTHHTICSITSNQGRIGTAKDGIFSAAKTVEPMTCSGEDMITPLHYATFYGMQYEVFDFNTPGQFIRLSVAENMPTRSTPDVNSLGGLLKHSNWIDSVDKDWTHMGSALPLPKVIYTHSSLDFRFRIHAWAIAIIDVQ